RHRHGGAARAPRAGGARLIRALLLALVAPLAAAQTSLTVYTSNAAPTIQALAADFENRTGIHIEVWRASSAKVLQRLVAEKKAERWDFDVVSAGGPEMEALYREGLLQAIDSPAERDLIEGTLPAHRGWAPQFINVFVQAYNTGLLRKQDLPRRWDDLLDAKWKGKLGVEAASAEWYCTLAKHMGEKQADELFRSISARNG